MKKIIILIGMFIVLLTSGCTVLDDSENMTIEPESDITFDYLDENLINESNSTTQWGYTNNTTINEGESCYAQFGATLVSGHWTGLLNENTGEVVEGCCCVGHGEFICLCPDKAEEIISKFFR